MNGYATRRGNTTARPNRTDRHTGQTNTPHTHVAPHTVDCCIHGLHLHLRLNRWAALSKCGSRAVDDTHAAPSDPSYIKYAYAGCAQGNAAVVLLEVRGLSGNGHMPFARAQVSPKSAALLQRFDGDFFQTTVNTTTLVWDFIRQFSRELLSPPPSPAPRSPPVDCPEGCVPKKPMRALLFASTHRCPEGCIPA